MKRATIIRRSLVGLVCTVGVGALYLAPSLAGPPEQIAVPAPTEVPSMEPTPFDTPTDIPTPLETTTADPFPTETAPTTTAPPTSSFPTVTRTTAPPYVPPTTTKPSKTKTTKPPKPVFAAVTGLAASSPDMTGFTLKWSEPDAGEFKVSGDCVGEWKSKMSVKMKFPRSGSLPKPCEVKVKALESSKFDAGPYSTALEVLPKLDEPVLTLQSKTEEDFVVTWPVVAGAKDYFVNPGDDCRIDGKVEVVNNNATVTIYFRTKEVIGCEVKIKAVEVVDRYLASDDSVISGRPLKANGNALPNGEFVPGG